ncbi:MAG: hypothetical protein QXU32_02105 [Nitrososphaerales archaeon]
MPYIPSNKTGCDHRAPIDAYVSALCDVIAEAVVRHGHEAAWAGELNYALTRIIQELPRSLIKQGVLKDEMRYWIQPLAYGVLLDVALEHKRRVNAAYEAYQIVKSGDCYDTPYYTKLVEVVDDNGKTIGYQEVMVKRSNDTLNKDIIGKMRMSGNH